MLKSEPGAVATGPCRNPQVSATGPVATALGSDLSADRIHRLTSSCTARKLNLEG